MLNNKPSILLIDDNFLVQDSLKKLLSTLDVSITCANNGQMALELIKEERFDLVFCDLLMPVLDGFKFCESVKSSEDYYDMQIVVLTSLDDKDELNKLRELGVDDIIIKPYNADEIISITKGKLKKVNDLRCSIEKDLEKNKKRILHTMSHEFRTPLYAIQSTSQLLIDRRNSFDDTKISKLLDSMVKGSERLERLIANFLTLQQLEIGIHKKEIEKKSKKYNLKDLVNDIVSDFKNNLENKINIDIEIIDCSCGVNVHIYDVYFKDVIERVLENAVKFSSLLSSNGEIKIEIDLLKELNNAIIEIKDRGIGFDDKKAQSALKLFTQIDREIEEQQGLGVGLFICDEYIKAHGGSLEIQNRDLGGTTVRIIIPCIFE